MTSTQPPRPDAVGRSGPEPRRRGRPRNVSYDRTVLDAALQVLIAKGYAGFTVDGVASRANVSRAAIYRRWPSRAALAVASLDALGRSVAQPTEHDTGSLREDLLAFQRERITLMNLPGYRPVMAGLLSDSVSDPMLADAIITGYQRHHTAISAALRRGISRGELRPGIDFEFVNDMLLGPLFTRSVLRGHRLGPDLADRTVDAVLAAVGTRTGHPQLASPSRHQPGPSPIR